MNYLMKTLKESVLNVYKPNKPLTEIEVSRKEVYMDFIYKVLTWKNSTITWNVLLVLHVLFWLIVQLELKPYGIIFMLLLVVFIWDGYFEQTKRLDISRKEYSHALKNTSAVFNEMILHLQILRKENPSVFCGSLCMGCLAIGFIAKYISGYIVTYLSMLTTFFGPLIFFKVPTKYTTLFKNIIHVINSTEGVVPENDFIPNIISKDFNGRRVMDLDMYNNDDKISDSVTNSFASGISSMPSYMEAENSQEDLEDLELPLCSTHISNEFYLNNSSDSDSEYRNIHFESSHYNDEASSEEENLFAQDLKISENINAVDSNSEVRPHNSQYINSIISNLHVFAGLINNVKTAVTVNVSNQQNTSDSDDFEIITDDEIEKQ